MEMAEEAMEKPSVQNINPNLHSRDFVPKISLSEDLQYWMTNLSERIKSVPIIYLAIPGSHDSFTSSITENSEIAPDADELIQKLKWLAKLNIPLLANWSKTQEYDVTEQLKAGIRYFDLRVSTKEGDSNFYFVHRLYSDNVQTVLSDINKFLDSHPQEVVILDLQHFYAFTDSDHKTIIQMLSKIFGAKLLPCSDHMDFITLNYMTVQHRYQVLIIYRSEAAKFGQPLLWPSECIPTPWANTYSTDDLFSFLDKGIKNRSSNVGYISQCILSPSYWYILRHIFSTLKETCAEDFEEQRLQWISNQKAGKGGMNIIIADFIDLSDCRFSKAVINLNEQLLKNL